MVIQFMSCYFFNILKHWLYLTPPSKNGNLIAHFFNNEENKEDEIII